MKHHWLALAIVVACVGSATAAPTPPPGPSASEMKWMSMHGPQNPDGLPKGVSAVLGCIPTMGYHYANLKDLPFGPYGWYDGKPTFTEIMVDQKLFESGKSWDEQLKPLPGYHIDHVDIWFEPHGHPGYPIPHYDIHAWYIPHAEHMTECGNKSGKKPAWLGS